MATLKELAELVGGTVKGDPATDVSRVAPIDKAGPGDITFVANPKYLSSLEQCKASAVIVSPGVEGGGVALLECRNPYLAFAKVLTHLHVQPAEVLGVMEGAHVSSSASVGEDVSIYPGCFVGEGVSIGRGTILHPGVVLYDGVTLGEDCILHAGAVVREGCRLGDRVILQPAAVIGSDGFGFAPDGSRYFKIPQVGIVEVGDDVEIGASSCVDRAALGVTRIGRGTKIDNLVQVAHNVVIGEDTILVSQVGIAGSTEIGNHCTFGGQSGTVGHIKVGNNVTIAGRGGVTRNVEDNQVLAGFPVKPHKEWLKMTMGVGRIGEMHKELGALKKQLAMLEEQIKER